MNNAEVLIEVARAIHAGAGQTQRIRFTAEEREAYDASVNDIVIHILSYAHFLAHSEMYEGEMTHGQAVATSAHSRLWVAEKLKK
ncbi:MAG: hypothetical protein NWE76_05380, partial [Candidatus Bathyarchaeota archaeon]|nr:hypothetical protein [Candidatus Bathyarchaeota archaeon]